jgi:hypothetical protein
MTQITRPPRLHIARRDPAANPAVLERRTSGVGDRLVNAGVRNENVVRHRWVRSLFTVFAD